MYSLDLSKRTSTGTSVFKKEHFQVVLVSYELYSARNHVRYSGTTCTLEPGNGIQISSLLLYRSSRAISLSQ